MTNIHHENDTNSTNVTNENENENENENGSILKVSERKFSKKKKRDNHKEIINSSNNNNGYNNIKKKPIYILEDYIVDYNVKKLNGYLLTNNT